MKRTRGSVVKKYVESSDSEDDRPLKKSPPAEKNVNSGDSSSSESDIENYLQKPEKLDLDSEFFNTKPSVNEFENIEKNIFAGVTRLSDSESDTDKNIDPDHEQLSTQEKLGKSRKKEQNESCSKLSFNQLQDYTRKIEEAKKQVEIYKAKKNAQEKKTDISNLLAAGERKTGIEYTITPADLHSSDFESCDSEQDDWEEIKVKASKEKDENLIPAKGLQITVDLPETVKKKKGVDLLAAMKRRLNRIRKENQVLVHKVHLLCWIAHGNYVNSAVNDTQTMAMALSLLPSEQCYPPDRTDLSYLEQIVAWYKRTVKNLEKNVPEHMPLTTCLQYQINRKEAYNKKMLAIIFVAILRALGIQARIVMSLQVEPLRPPANELHSLSIKENKNSKKTDKSSKDKRVTSGQQQVQSKTLSLPITKNEGSPPGTSNSLSSVQVKPKIKVNIEAPSPDKNNKNIDKNTNLISDDKTRSSQSRKNASSPNKNPVVKTDKIGKSPKNNNKNSITNEDKSKVNVPKPRGRSKSSEIGNSERKISEQKNTNRKANNNQKSEKLQPQDKKTVQTSDNKNRDKNHLAPNQTKSRKRAKSTESIDSVQSNSSNNSRGTRRKQEAESSSLLKPEGPKERKRAKSTESIDSVQSNSSRRSTRSMTGTGSKTVSVPNLTAASTANLKKGTKTRTPKASDGTTASRSKSAENSKASRSKKIISQVDGVYDSDSDAEKSILQLDGTNDKQQSKQKQKPNLKTLKKPSKADKDVKTKPNLKSLNGKNGPKTIVPKKEIDSDSDSEFEPPNGSPFKRSLEKAAPDLRKLNHIKRQSTKQLDIKEDVVSLVKKRISEQKRIERSRMVRKRKPNPDSDTDSDYVPEPIKKKHHDSEDDFVPKVKVKKRVQVHPVISDSDSEKKKKKKKGNDVWVEVFLEAEEKWITADVVHGQVHCIKEISARASHPISYVLAWNNNNYLKDVTQRYCPNFNTITRKLRVDPKWWNDSLKPFMGIPTARDKEEDDDLARQQLDQPLPKSIAEYKNHPLYALKRHLLKFEAIYPPEPPTLGFIRGEAVYPRSCVYTLHSRDIWLKQAKVVKLGEEPYKIVKARPKWDKLSNKAITDQLLEIFGPWQVQDYEPPTAENGIVPRNAFGNVDLFKPCMLPKGCVHLKLPGLNKIARKMNIDCASAIVGFDFHGGWSHPVYDGFVVCKEYEDQMICAWELEQDELDRKEQEKIDKRVYGNWKKLIRGLLIRERLKAKYDFGATSSSAAKDQKKNKAPTFCTKKR